MTNFERIKEMSVEEMASDIAIKVKNACLFCAHLETVKKYGIGCPYCYEEDYGCECGIKKWLESEVEEE